MLAYRIILACLACTALVQSAEAQRIYWWAYDDGLEAIYRCNLDGSNVEPVGLGTEPGLALDLVAGKAYWAAGGLIVRSNLDGSEVEPVTGYVRPPVEMALDLLHGKLYWRDSVGIFRVNMDGSDAENLLYDAVFCLCGFALDPANDIMYWVVNSAPYDLVMRADLDGQNSQQLITEGLSSPHSLALDTVEQKLYFLDYGSIYRANTDGTGKELLVDWPQILSGVRLAVDTVHRKLYWTDHRPPAIHRANLDGTVPETVLYVEDLSHEPSSITVDPRVPGDCGSDGSFGSEDHEAFTECLTGPVTEMSGGCACSDVDGDARVDLVDFLVLQRTSRQK